MLPHVLYLHRICTQKCHVDQTYLFNLFILVGPVRSNVFILFLYITHVTHLHTHILTHWVIAIVQLANRGKACCLSFRKVQRNTDGDTLSMIAMLDIKLDCLEIVYKLPSITNKDTITRVQICLVSEVFSSLHSILQPALNVDDETLRTLDKLYDADSLVWGV